MANNNPFSDESSSDNQQSDTIGRREFLGQAAGLFTAGLFGGAAPYLLTSRKSLKYPFMLGVASGDPWPHSVLLWTRLAPEPLLGGDDMPDEPVNVQWEVARTSSFHDIIKKGTAQARPHYAHSLHIDVKGLQPNTHYYYRFKTGNTTSPTGRTKTAPAPDDKLDELNIAFASCQRYSAGFYNAYDHMAKEDLDVVFFLGDYIYENHNKGDIGRWHRPQKKCMTLKDYRIRYGQYKSSPRLQKAHAAFPWIAVEDDHEVENDWAGKKGNPGDWQYENQGKSFLARRAAAFQAYYEHLPFRKQSMPHNIDMQLYRSFTYGNLAEFNVLDTRQYRTGYACNNNDNVNPKACNEIYDTSRSIIGHKQEQWLFDNLKQSSASWNIVPQQVLMAQFDYEKGPGKVLDMDKWDGYVATRNRLMNTIKQNDIKNMVVLTGDYHRNMANNLLEDFDDPQSPVLASELLGTSITSDGDGQDITQNGKMAMEENPNIKFFNAQRGYVRCKITPQYIRADFRVVPVVEKPGSPIHTRATFKIKNGSPGVRTYRS